MSNAADAIALVGEGAAEDPAYWSGIPAGLAKGCRSFGWEAMRLSADPPAGVTALARVALTPFYGNRHAPRVGRELAALRTRLVARRLSSVVGLAAVVQMGTGFRLEARVPRVTYEDMTVRQALRLPDSGFAHLPDAVVETWIARQREAYAAARACCVASRWAADSIRLDYGVATEKIHCVGFGRNLELRAKPRNWDRPRFLWVGRDWERKKGATVVRAFSALRDHFPEARLDVVGEHPRLSAPGVVTHGPVRLTEPEERERVAALFEGATVFVMPSEFEPFGIVYVEAGSAGVPSIGTTVGGAADAVGPGGVLVEPGDEASLLDAMRRLSDPDAVRALGAKAYDHAQAYSWEAVADRVLSALGMHAEGTCRPG